MLIIITAQSNLLSRARIRQHHCSILLRTSQLAPPSLSDQKAQIEEGVTKRQLRDIIFGLKALQFKRIKTSDRR